MLDVIVEPGPKVLPRASFIHGTAKLHEDLDRLLPLAVKRAKETWRRGATEGGMVELVREIRDQHTNEFPFEFYTQLPLAYSFLLARLRDLASAESELDRYTLPRRLDDEVVSKLKELAREYASRVGRK